MQIEAKELSDSNLHIGEEESLNKPYLMASQKASGLKDSDFARPRLIEGYDRVIEMQDRS